MKSRVNEESAAVWYQSVNYGYEGLALVLKDALEQAQSGKGAERHGEHGTFSEQPVMTVTEQVGLGFPLGQAMKKIIESQRTGITPEAAKAERLGAIVYIAAAILADKEYP